MWRFFWAPTTYVYWMRNKKIIYRYLGAWCVWRQSENDGWENEWLMKTSHEKKCPNVMLRLTHYSSVPVVPVKPDLEWCYIQRRRLTLCLLVPSIDNRWKHSGPRSGPTICQAWSGSWVFDIPMAILKDFFEKVVFETCQRATKKVNWSWKCAMCRFTQACAFYDTWSLIPILMIDFDPSLEEGIKNVLLHTLCCVSKPLSKFGWIWFWRRIA